MALRPCILFLITHYLLLIAFLNIGIFLIANTADLGTDKFLNCRIYRFFVSYSDYSQE
jgi:hypothetical protein